MQKKGFTLIELLVVVLIIGILSAIALPQYQRSVERARAAEAWVGASALIPAIEEYCLANGASATIPYDFASVSSITVPDSEHFTFSVNHNNFMGPLYCRHFYDNHLGAIASSTAGDAILAVNRGGVRFCAEKTTNSGYCKRIGFANAKGNSGCFSGFYTCFTE